MTNTTAYLQARGLPVNSFSLNGIVLSAEALSEAMMQLLGREQYILATAVRSGQLTDKSGSIFNSILELTPERSFTRYHRILEETSANYVDFMQTKWQSLLESSTFFYDYTKIPSLTRGELEETDGFVNSVLVFASVTEKGLTSVSEAVSWIAGKSAEGSHRLSVSYLLSSQESDCLGLLLKQRLQVENIQEEAVGSYILSRLETVCHAALLPSEQIVHLQRVVAQEIAQRLLTCIHSKETKDVSAVTISSTGDAISNDNDDNSRSETSFCTRYDMQLLADRFHTFKSIDYLTSEIAGADNAMVVTSLTILLQRSSLAKAALGWTEVNDDKNVGGGDGEDKDGSDSSDNHSTPEVKASSASATSTLSDKEDVSVVFYNARKLQLLHGAKHVQNSAKMDASLASEGILCLHSD